MKSLMATYLTSFLIFISSISFNSSSNYVSKTRYKPSQIDSLYNQYMSSKKDTIKVLAKDLKKDIKILRVDNNRLVYDFKELKKCNDILKSENLILKKDIKNLKQNIIHVTSKKVEIKRDSIVLKKKGFFGRMFSKSDYDTIKN